MRRLKLIPKLTVGAVGVALAMVISVNLALNAGWVTDFINRNQGDVVISFERAWTWWPGRISARGLRIIGHDSQVEWLLTADQATTQIEISGLFEQVFRVRDAFTQNVTFRARRTRGLDELCKPDGTYLPQLPAHANPVVERDLDPDDGRHRCLGQTDTAKRPSGNTDPSRLWQIDLHDVIAEDLNDLWIEHYRFRGHARVDGGFYLWPSLRVSLSPTRFLVRTGTIALGQSENVIVKNLEARGEGRIDPSSVELSPTSEIIQNLSLTATVSAEVDSVRLANFYLSKARWLHLDGGSGVLAATLTIDHGRIAEGTDVRIDTKSLQARVVDHVAVGAGHLEWRVRAEAEKPTGTLSVELDRYVIHRRGSKTAQLRGRQLGIRIVTSNLKLTSPFDDFDANVIVKNAVAPDFTVYNDYLPASTGLQILSGSATISGALAVRGGDRVDSGHFQLRAAGMSAQYRKLKFRGDLELDVPVSGADFDTNVFDIRGSKARLLNIFVDERNEEGLRSWWCDVELTRARVSPGPKPLFDALVSIRMRDLRPLLALYAEGSGLPKWVQNLLSAEGAAGSFSVFVNQDNLRLDDLVVAGSGLQAQARARVSTEGSRGSLLLTHGALAVGLDVMGDEVSVNLWNPTSKFYEGAAIERKTKAPQSRIRKPKQEKRAAALSLEDLDQR